LQKWPKVLQFLHILLYSSIATFREAPRYIRPVMLILPWYSHTSHHSFLEPSCVLIDIRQSLFRCVIFRFSVATSPIIKIL
jgi:hypothetical protein